MKNKHYLPIFLTAIAISSAQAASVVAINFMRTATTTPAANDGSEYAISIWDDVDGSAGNATSVDGILVEWTGGGVWNGGGNNVENGYLDNLGSLTLSNLSTWLGNNGATTYTVQLIQASDTVTNWFGDSQIRETDVSGSLLDTLTNSNYQRGATSISTDLSADILFIDPTTGGVEPGAVAGAAPRTSVAGLIIRANVVPEPTSVALLGLGGLALILRRRK